MGKHVPLNKVGEGAEGVIAEVRGELKFRRRLREMGFLPGAYVKVVKRAPLHDPWEYAIKGSHVSLRRREAAQIIVEVEE